MKKLLVSIAMLFLILSVSFASTSDPVDIIDEYIDNIRSNKWDEFVDLFNYDHVIAAELKEFLNNPTNKSSKEGIHGVQNIKLVNLNQLTEGEFSDQGDVVYDVTLEMKVHKESEFYHNGNSRHIFVFNRVNGALKLDYVVYKGPINIATQDSFQKSFSYIPIEPAPRPIPSSIKIYDTSKKQLKTLSLNVYLKDVLPNEIYLSWHAESIKANIVAAKTYAWYNIENPRSPATTHNAHVTDQHTSYQKYVEGSNHSTTNYYIDYLYDVAMIRGKGPFDAQYRGGSPGSLGIQGSNVMKQWGSHELAKQGYNYAEILYYYSYSAECISEIR